MKTYNQNISFGALEMEDKLQRAKWLQRQDFDVEVEIVF
jgi:hypothetical protein